MPRIRRTFSPELKSQVVLELLSGAATPAEIARRHQVKPQLLAHWKAAVLERLPTFFGGDDASRQHEVRIAELEQLVGRQALEIEILPLNASILFLLFRSSFFSLSVRLLLLGYVAEGWPFREQAGC